LHAVGFAVVISALQIVLSGFIVSLFVVRSLLHLLFYDPRFFTKHNFLPGCVDLLFPPCEVIIDWFGFGHQTHNLAVIARATSPLNRQMVLTSLLV
jgi:hypothetical protein